MAVAVYLIGNINVLIIEGVGVKYWLAQASSLMLLLLIENATRHTAKMR
jgi:uncharacterized membrane protein